MLDRLFGLTKMEVTMSCNGCPRRQPNAARPFQRVVVAATLLLATACSQIDPLADKFQQVRIGDSRARVVAVMGPPDSVNTVEVLLIKAEQIIWRAQIKGRAYIVLIVMDKIALKAAVD
jgi:hypothetical protein